MEESKAHIISRLQKEIILMQGFKPAGINNYNNSCLYNIRQSFPNGCFPSGAIHEFFYKDIEDSAASCAFIGGIISSLMKKGGAVVWISASQNIFPPALQSFGIHPDKIIFIHLKKEKERLWAMKETLKCDGICAVTGEIDEISFIESRKFQLAVEQTRATGFLIRRNPKNLSTACVTRWRIKPIKGGKEMNGMPGIGFPRWNVELLKVRNGKPGNWQMEWRKKHFQLIQNIDTLILEAERKVV